MSRRDYNYELYCLDQWAQWILDHNGFPSRSPILKFGENPAHIAESSIPSGVEPRNRDAERANLILAMMTGSRGSSPRRAYILKLVAINQKGGESVAETLKRACEGISKQRYSEALEEFAVRLETILFQKVQDNI